MYKILDIIDDIEKELNIKIEENIKDILHDEYIDIDVNDKREFKNDVLKHLVILQKKSQMSNEV